MKYIAFLIFFILLGSMLISENLTIWVSWEGLNFFEEKAEEFIKDTGHNIEILFVPDMEEKLLTSIKTGNLPDLALIKDVHSGYLTHVNTLYRIKDEDLEQLGAFREEDLRVFSVNNEVVAIPYYADLQVAFVNQKILKESGYELSYNYTIDDIREIKDDFENSEIVPAAWDFMSPYVFYPFAVHGAELIDENGKLQMDSGSLAETILNIKELFNENVFERYERGALVEGFSSGKIAIILQGSYLSPTFEQNEIDFEMLPFPIMNGKRIKGLIDSKGFAILNSAKEDAALEFIDFLYSNSTSYCEKYYKVPLWDESDSNKLKDLRDVLKESQYMEQSENFQRLYFRVMRTVLQSVYSETMTVEESLHNAQEFVNKNW
ncbi:MAG: sugar ABC transporter substrate-binding protein [Kosmotogaceae bacterium]